MEITPDIVDRFCAQLMGKLIDGESQFGKVYLNLLVDEIRVNGEKVCITGHDTTLVRALKQKEVGDSYRVPTSVRVWLPEPDGVGHWEERVDCSFPKGPASQR